MFSVELFSKASVDEMVAELPYDFAPFKEIFKGLKDKSLSSVESQLDRFYFTAILEFTKRIPRQAELFRNFLLTQVHHANILTFLRLRKELPKEELQSYLILPQKDPDNEYFRKLFGLEQDAEILAHLSKRYPEITDLSSLIAIESALQTHLLKKTLRFEHQDPLSIYAILSYLFAKEIEIQNIKKIVKAKHLGIDMALIEPQVIA